MILYGLTINEYKFWIFTFIFLKFSISNIKLNGLIPTELLPLKKR